MVIQHIKSENKGRFFVEVGGDMAGELLYSMQGNKEIIIEHTEVKASLRGKKIGFELVQACVQYARQYHLKIQPVCRFALAVFKKEANFQDVWIHS